VRVRAILNPRAGLAARRAQQAVEAGPWPGLELVVTEGPGHARELAKQAAADGCELVLALGGDGTANEVGWGLLGSSSALGLVPVGSGNGLARTLGIPLHPERAVAALAAAVTRRMDVGFANDKPFLNVAGAGLDAVVGADFHARGKQGNRRGILPYVMLSLKRAFSYRAERWSLVADETHYEGRAWVMAFSNGRQYGAGAVLAPAARLDDGLLEVVVFEDAGLLAAFVSAPRLFLGGIERARGYRRLAASSAVLATERPFPHHRDGEPEDPCARLEIRLVPQALGVLVPRAAAEDPLGVFGVAHG
jgi:YegS/Rv2252/BmrU family lipid kinase